MEYFGIDPGASGGVALLDEDGSLLMATAIPETPHDLVELLKRPSGARVRVMMEKVAASPMMGVTSAFSFGKNFGTIIGVVSALQIPYDFVSPTKWMKIMECAQSNVGKREVGEKRRDKNLSKMRAQQLFPSAKVTHAVADAMLIAEYARRVYTGKIFNEGSDVTALRTQQRRVSTSLF